MIKKVNAVLKVEFFTEEHARAAKDSLDPDNVISPPTKIVTEVKGRVLQISVQDAPSFGSLENTLVEFVDHLQMQLDLEKTLTDRD